MLEGGRNIIRSEGDGEAQLCVEQRWWRRGRNRRRSSRKESVWGEAGIDHVSDRDEDMHKHSHSLLNAPEKEEITLRFGKARLHSGGEARRWRLKTDIYEEHVGNVSLSILRQNSRDFTWKLRETWAKTSKNGISWWLLYSLKAHDENLRTVVKLDQLTQVIRTGRVKNWIRYKSRFRCEVFENFSAIWYCETRIETDGKVSLNFNRLFLNMCTRARTRQEKRHNSSKSRVQARYHVRGETHEVTGSRWLNFF